MRISDRAMPSQMTLVSEFKSERILQCINSFTVNKIREWLEQPAEQKLQKFVQRPEIRLGESTTNQLYFLLDKIHVRPGCSVQGAVVSASKDITDGEIIVRVYSAVSAKSKKDKKKSKIQEFVCGKLGQGLQVRKLYQTTFPLKLAEVQPIASKKAYSFQIKLFQGFPATLHLKTSNFRLHLFTMLQLKEPDSSIFTQLFVSQNKSAEPVRELQLVNQLSVELFKFFCCFIYRTKIKLYFKETVRRQKLRLIIQFLDGSSQQPYVLPEFLAVQVWMLVNLEGMEQSIDPIQVATMRFPCTKANIGDNRARLKIQMKLPENLPQPCICNQYSISYVAMVRAEEYPSFNKVSDETVLALPIKL